MFEINISPHLKSKLPSLILGCIQANVTINKSSKELEEFISTKINEISVAFTHETIRNLDTVKATKNAYKSLGKDPNRYRPAAESLMRRIAQGKGLYQISNAVDILNYISVKTGYSICGYDASCINGQITLGIGEENEPYEGIGRGTINIESLPVFRDNIGAFGTPTSDSVRTMISSKTNTILFVFIGFGNKDGIENAMQETNKLLKNYANAENVETFFQ